MEIPGSNAGKVDLGYLLKVIMNLSFRSVGSQMWHFITITIIPLTPLVASLLLPCRTFQGGF